MSRRNSSGSSTSDVNPSDIVAKCVNGDTFTLTFQDQVATFTLIHMFRGCAVTRFVVCVCLLVFFT